MSHHPPVAVVAVLVTAFSNALRRTLPALSAAAVTTAVPTPELVEPELAPELGTFVEPELAPDPDTADDPVDDEPGVDGTLMLLDGGECDKVSVLLELEEL